MQRIRKAVFPVAGLGTRFLPATKAMPKEMLTVVDRPVIQHVVDEARAAGIEHLIFVTGRGKAVIEDHFDRAYELEATLEARGKKAELEILKQAQPGAGETSFTRQQSVGNEPFAVLLPDVLVLAKKSCLAQMIDAHTQTGDKTNLIAVEKIAPDQTHQYGVVGMGAKKGPAFEITSMVEKPAKGTAPSNNIVTGRYILQPEIFEVLEKQERGAGGEIQLTDAMIALAKSQKFYGFNFDGTTYDCGSKLGFLAANVAFGLARADIAESFRAELKRITASAS